MSYDSKRAISKAQKLIALYGTRNPWVLVDHFPSVAVVQVNLGENIMGYSLISRRMSVINLNERMDREETDGVLTHELGHTFLTRETRTNYFYKGASEAAIDSSEFIANCFMFQFMFGNRGPINPMNHDEILSTYGLPTWMNRYFDLIDQEELNY